jgi:hypothetical protein
MDFLAFASFAALILAWLFAPSKTAELASEERVAA